MSDVSSLTELARFIGQSPLGATSGTVHSAASASTNAELAPRPVRPRVSELLAVVLTLSARTRRMVMPAVEIDLDVFAPGGARACRLMLPGSAQQ